MLTIRELQAALDKEVRILLHLASKVDPGMLDYRPTPKQRSLLELLRYLSFGTPELLRAGKAGDFAPEPWKAAEQAAAGRTFDEAVAAIATQPEQFKALLAGMSEADFRTDIVMWGTPMSRGAFLSEYMLGGCAAYRMQLFLYLKACGRDLNTWNLWDGTDPPAKDATAS